MLPYLIAGAIGGGLALRKKKKYAKGGTTKKFKPGTVGYVEHRF